MEGLGHKQYHKTAQQEVSSGPVSWNRQGRVWTEQMPRQEKERQWSTVVRAEILELTI